MVQGSSPCGPTFQIPHVSGEFVDAKDSDSDWDGGFLEFVAQLQVVRDEILDGSPHLLSGDALAGVCGLAAEHAEHAEHGAVDHEFPIQSGT